MFNKPSFAPVSEWPLDSRPINPRPFPIDRRRIAAATGSCRSMALGAVVASLLVGLGTDSTAHAEDLAARRVRLRQELSQAIQAQDRWLGSGTNGSAWRARLNNETLHCAIHTDAMPDVIALHEVLYRYKRPDAGLDRKPFTEVRGSLSRWLEVLPEPTPQALATLAETDMNRHTLVDDERLGSCRAALQARFDTLETYLAHSTRHGAAWRRYLDSDELAQQLKLEDSADLQQLERILDRYESGHAGLELEGFRDVQQALARYCRHLRAWRLEDQQGDLKTTLERLTASLKKVHRRPSSRNLEQVGTSLVWLDQHGLAPRVAHAVKHRYVQPNLHMRISGEMLFSQLGRTIDEQFEIRDRMNGAFINGSANLNGRVSLELVPNPEQATFEMHFDGLMRSDTIGHSGPVGFSSDGLTRLNGQKRIVADADGFRAMPATAHATTSLHVGHVWSSFALPLKDRIARRIGSRRLREGRPSNERTVSAKAKENLTDRIEQEAAILIDVLNETYVEKIRIPLTKEGIFPADLRLSSTRDHFCIQATQASLGQLAASSRPPRQQFKSDIVLVMHESLINNSTATTLSGQTIKSEELAAVLAQMLGTVPAGFESVNGDPWALALADNNPLEFRVSEGEVRVTIRCQGIASGDKHYNVPFAVGARYRIGIEGNAIALDRLGDLEITAPSLGTQAQTEGDDARSREEVRMRFEMLFQERLRFTASQLPLDLPPEVEVLPTELQCKDGWLLLGFTVSQNRPTILDNVASE